MGRNINFFCALAFAWLVFATIATLVEGAESLLGSKS